jgi:hypothetical protein
MKGRKLCGKDTECLNPLILNSIVMELADDGDLY